MKTRLLIKPNVTGDITNFRFNDNYLEFFTRASIPVNSVVEVSIDDEIHMLYVISLNDGWYSTNNELYYLPTKGKIINVYEYEEPNGDIDTTFNIGTGPNNQIIDIQVDKNNKYVVVGDFTQIGGTSANYIARLNYDGSLDASFTGSSDVIRGLLIEDDNKYVIVGRGVYAGTSAYGIARVLGDGTADPTFYAGLGINSLNLMYAIDVASNGSYIVVGSFQEYKGATATRIVQILPNGDIDSSFDYGSGLGGGDAYSCVVDNDGNIFVGGEFNSYKGATANQIVKIKPNGDHDTTFNASMSGGNVTRLYKKPNGNIIATGSFTAFNGFPANRYVEFTTDGVNVSTSRPFNNSTVRYTRQLNNKEIFSGNFTTYNSATQNRAVRTPAGSIVRDNSFNIGAGFNNTTEIVQVQDGKLMAFRSFTTYKGTTQTRIVRLKGSLKSLSSKVYELDLKDNIVFPLNFNIADIKNPQNRKSNFSKNIKLPGTDKNSQVISQMFEIDINGAFNPAIKHDIIVIQDGLEIFTGYMKLNSVIRSAWNEITYDISLDGELSDIFSKLKNDDGSDMKLSDLDFSEWDHSRSAQSIVDSWFGNTLRDGNPYSSIDFQFVGLVEDTEFAPGNMTTYVIGPTAAATLAVGDVVAFLMDNPGSTTINFDQSSGSHTIIGFRNDGEPVVNLQFSSGDTNPGTLYKLVASGEGYVYPTIYQGGGTPVDTLNYTTSMYSPALYVKTIVDKIFSTISFDYDSQFFDTQFFKRLIHVGKLEQLNPLTLNLVEGSEFEYVTEGVRVFTAEYSDTFNLEYFVELFELSNYIGFTDGSRSISILQTIYNANGSLASGPIASTILSSGTLIAPGTVSHHELQATINIPTTLTTGQYVVFQIRDENTEQESSAKVVNWTLTNKQISLADYVGDMTCKDFLTSLISMFNLYLEVDKVDSNKLIIEPYNDYYDGFIDWTDKVDISKDVTIEMLNNSVSKTYKFQYEQDGDYLNKDYIDGFANRYGTSNISIDNEFVTRENVITTKYAPTPLSDEANNAVIIQPSIYKDIGRNFVDAIKPRILYFTGLRYVSEDFTINNQLTQNLAGLTGQVSFFGYAGHVDDPLSATLDLSFAAPERYYYGQSYPFWNTTNTLYNRFYKDYIEEISSKESRTVRFWMKLNSFDIATLSFRKHYYIRGNFYKLQKVNDYNPITSQSVLCEFILSTNNKSIN